MDAKLLSVKKMVNQKRRRQPPMLQITKRMLLCGFCAIVSGFLLLVHAPRIFPLYSSSGYTTTSTSILIHGRTINENEQSWTTELSRPVKSDGVFLSRELMDAKGDSNFAKLWRPPENHDFSPCVDRSTPYKLPNATKGYLLVQTNGGLNQMRAGICDMVAVARMINATLVVPELDKKSFWLDSSNFSDVFDEEHFISALADDVRVVRKLPKEMKHSAKIFKEFKSWSGLDYYQEEISKLFETHKVIHAAKSDSRLSNNNLPSDYQKLRCRTCYDALRFASHIESLGKLLVERMRSYGPFVALHLRYEKDMLAFSGCANGLSEEEVDELTKIRNEMPHWKVKKINPKEQRSRGLCPMTPKEVAMFLAGLGFPPTTPIYIAAGRIYGGESKLADLRRRFPVLITKEKLASRDELKRFANHASQMAALDYIVSVESDVFIPTHNGNMARAVAGHRRMLGHRKTISPDSKEIVRLFDRVSRGKLKEDASLSRQIIEIHRKRQGSPRRRRGPKAGTKGTERFRSEETFYENPLPECLCRRQISDLKSIL